MYSSQSSNTTSDSELTPLVGTATFSNGAENNSNGNYYFLDRKESFKSQQATSRANPEVEKLPQGATENEFASRPVMGGASTSGKKVGFFSKHFRNQNVPGEPGGSNNVTIGSLMKKRQASIKIEPKVFFANERTFLAWLHASVLLAGASIAIVSMSDDNLLDQLYGVILLPIAIAFMVYSMHQYGKRAQLIRRRAPGPYEDIIGPSVLAVALMMSIVVQFSVKLYAILN